MLIIKILPFVILVALVSGTVFLWERIPLPCDQPILYSLGTFDTRFNLSEPDFLKELASAEIPWERALGKDLFRYSPGASFKINLIFDERQSQTIEAQKLEVSLEKTKNSKETLDVSQEKLVALYEQAKKEYERLVIVFKRQLDVYNAEVSKWNTQGGAPPEAYENLQAVAKKIEKDGRNLETKRQEVNNIATKINAFAKQQVAVVEEYNGQVEQYVDRYGAPKEFDQGEYVGQEINIYQFDNQPRLQAVLVHEFGHALGLGHGTVSSSMMYHLMKDQPLSPLRLSAEDQLMLETQCSQTAWDIVFERIGILSARVSSLFVF